MHTIACNAEEIRQVNQQKEYTLISTQLLQCLYQDRRLNDHVIKCWQLLFNKSRFHANLEVTISYSNLAQELGKSKRTIIRYIQTLFEHGYLGKIHHENQRSGKLPNTLLIRVPQALIDRVKDTKDRGVVQHPKSTIPRVTVRPEEARSTVSKGEIAAGSAEPEAHRDVIAFPMVGPSRRRYRASSGRTAVTPLTSGPSDNPVTQKANKSKNNNNTVVEDRNLQKLKAKLIDLGELIKAESYKLKAMNQDRAGTIQQLEHLQLLESQATFIHHEIARLEKQNLQHQTAEKENNQIQTTLAQANIAPVNPFSLKRLHKSLRTLGFAGAALDHLTHEIVFEIRMGSLRKSNITGLPLSEDHALNVALKLIREKRWSTPVLGQKYGR